DWRALPFHLFLLQCLWPLPSPRFYYYLNVPSWSISCEFFFYLLAPLTIFLVTEGRRRWLPALLMGGYACVLGAVLSTGAADSTRLYLVSWFAPSRFVEFLVGVFIAHFYLTGSNQKLRSIASYLQVTGLALIICGALYRPDAPWPLWGGLLYTP